MSCRLITSTAWATTTGPPTSFRAVVGAIRFARCRPGARFCVPPDGGRTTTPSPRFVRAGARRGVVPIVEASGQLALFG
jgi:hypothetical protein